VDICAYGTICGGGRLFVCSQVSFFDIHQLNIENAVIVLKADTILSYVIVDLLSGHNIQANVISIFMPPAIQSTTCIFPVPSDMNPPATAPTNMHIKASTLRFLLIFSFNGAVSFGSEDRSHNIDVRTTLGISARFKVLLPMIWPED